MAIQQNQSKVTTQQFLEMFPAFQCQLNDIPSMLEQARIFSGGFKGIANEEKRCLALMLLTAHFLTLEARASKQFGGVIKSIKSRHDKIDFETGSYDDLDGLFGLGSTSYGGRLMQLLRWCYKGGFVTPPGCQVQLGNLTGAYGYPY